MAPLVSSEAELDGFNNLCLRLADFGANTNGELADGFLTAFAVAPLAVPLPVQLEALFEDAFERCFADPGDAQQAMAVFASRQRALVSQLNAQALLDDPDLLRMQPLMNEWDDAGRAEVLAAGELSTEDVAQLVTGAAWATGFAQAVAVMESLDDVWPVPHNDEAMAAYNELFDHVMAMTFVEGDVDMRAHLERYYARLEGRAAPTRDDLIDEACRAVQDLRLWWLSHGPKPAPRFVPTKPGRNDPCHCGSGKKYKKCHSPD